MKKVVMNKNKKNRSGSMSNEEYREDAKNARKRTSQPGAPAKSNRQTGGNKKDDSEGIRKQTTKKGPNSI